MAVDFDALDLVRSRNKSRAYNRKLDELQQQVTSLQELVEAVVRELPEDKKWSFEERLKKIKKSS
jgi:protoporphyrinogen oxidase|tara:strand:+ start:313 stop:507 length:195 start_codon:yes stop_codon:yes gene_type:complete